MNAVGKHSVGMARGMDRFWNLPEPIIDHVFSFLEMDDMARIGQMFDPIPHQKFESKCFYDGPPDSCNQLFAWISIAATITVMQM